MSTLARIFWGALLIKLIVAAALPLTNDEAYYWVWSKHMQLSFFDHPPMVAWLYWLGDFVKFFPGSVRWPGVLLVHAGLGLWLKILKPYLNEDQRRMWLWLALLSPLVGGSAIVVTPDVPLMFFYAAALWMFVKWDAKPNWLLSLAFGLTMGLGFTGKYMMVLFALSLIPLIFISARVRSAFFRYLPMLVLGAILGATPVWLWNYLNDFASLKFQAAHGLGRSWKPSWTYEYILLQIGVIFPVVLYWALRAGRRLPPVFHLLAWVPLVFFLCTTSRGYVEANWPIAAYPAVFALAVSWYPQNRKGLLATATLWGTLLAALLVLVIARPNWSRGLKLREFHQFDAVVAQTKEITPLYARSYQMAAKLSFEQGRQVYKLRGMNRRDFYDFREESLPREKEFYLAADKEDQLPKEIEGASVIQKTPIDDRFELWKVQVQP